ncbi:MAG: hypothetical protein WAO76_05640 [Georgfuchsia sp.]
MAATGAFLDGRCYASPDEAVDAYYSGSAPALTSGSTSYLTEFFKESGVWRAKSWSIASNGNATLRYNVVAPIPTFQACDPAEAFLDGVSVGWGIAAAIVIAACILQMKRGAAA